MSETITYSRATGAEIERLCTKIDEVMEGEPASHVNIACLAMSVIIQIPEIKAEQLIEAVKGASEWIALFGSNLRHPVSKERMN